MEEQVFSDQSDSNSQDEQLNQLDNMFVVTIPDYQLSKAVKTFWSKFSNNHEVRIRQAFHFERKVAEKSVCAKIIGRGQTIIECYDCRADPSCIICLDCFKNGNHQNHKYVIKTAFGGCCDCGDGQAWAKQGFCSKHSGEMLDVNIPPQEINAFVKVFIQLFYLYFKHRRSMPEITKKYFIELFGYLKSLNQDSVYYNKMTTVLFSRKISKIELPLAGHTNQICILGNLLSYESEIISNVAMDLFITMFPYYPFKQLLLSNYFRYFHLLYDGTEKALGVGSSIACQILTSYQLVDDHVKNKNQIGLGELIKQKKTIKKTNNVVYMLIHDLHTFAKLQGATPQHFWQFQIRRGIHKLFLSYEHFKSEVAGSIVQGTSEHQKANQYGDLSQIQYKILELFFQIINCLKGDRQTLIILLKFLYEKVREQEQTKTITVFRPYQRALSIVLFSYFEMNLDNCCNNFKNQLLQILEISQQKFQIEIIVLTKKMMKTYFFYTKIITEAGLSSTYASYFYFYKYKGRMMMSIDVVLIKMCLLMSKNDPVITPQKLIDLDSENSTDLQKIHLQKYLLIFKDITHLYVSKTAEIFLTMAIDKTSDIYQTQIKEMVTAVCFEIKDNINKENIKLIEESFVHPNVGVLDRYLKKMCNFSKQKKKFELKQQFHPQQGVNFNDFRSNFQTEQPFQNIKKTNQFIGQIQKRIMLKIWSEQTILKSIKLFHHMLSVFIAQQNQSIKVLIYELYKVYQILKLANSKEAFHLYQKILIVTQIRKHLPENLKLESDKSIKSDMVDQEDQRKQKIKQIQAKKMQQIRDKQKKALNTMQITSNSQNLNKMQNQDQTQLFCGICRNQNKQDMVYLCNVGIRNYEKTCGLTDGKGVQCLSFKSCYHAFDHKCIMKHIRTPVFYFFKCPMCRQISNCLLPCNQNKQLANDLMAKIGQMMFQDKDYVGLDISQEILKSFYHYILLCLIDLEHTLKKKLPIYKHLLSMLKFTIERKQLMALLKKLVNHKFILIHTQNKAKAKPKPNKTAQLMQMLQNLANIGHMDLSEVMNSVQNVDEDNSDPELMQLQQESQFSPKKKTTNKKKSLISRKKSEKKVSETKDQQEELQTGMFRNVIYRVICHMLSTQQDYEKHKIEVIPAEYEQTVQIGLNALFDQETPVSSILNKVSTQQGPRTTKMSKFRSLPSRYTPLGKIKTCSVCKQISANLALCLYCEDMAVCLKCKTIKAGMHKHAKQQHGDTCAFLYLPTTVVKVSMNGQLFEYEHAYKDEYGGPFKMSGNWDEYQLDEMLVLNVMQHLQWDQIETKGKKVQ